MSFWKEHGLRGSYLETCINNVNDKYLERGLAVVQKIPTAITPVELDREHGNIKRAYFEAKSTVDYVGNVQGIPVCFDAKETSVMRLPISNIHEHQIHFMDAFQQQEGLAFLIVLFKSTDESFLLPFETLKSYWDQAKKKNGRKSIPYDAFDQRLRIPSESDLFIHWLSAMNIYLSIKSDSSYNNNLKSPV